MFLYSAQSTLHFTPWQTCSFRHQFSFSGKNSTISSHAAILTARKLFTHISTSVYIQVLIFTAEWTGALWREQKWPNFETAAKGIPTQALSRLRVRHSTAELLRSTAWLTPTTARVFAKQRKNIMLTMNINMWSTFATDFIAITIVWLLRIVCRNNTTCNDSK